MQFIEHSIIGIRSAVITLVRRSSPLAFVLIPMVHIGEREFFAEVAARARRCDLIVAEGLPSRYVPVQKWVSTLRFDSLVDQTTALDLEHLGVPVQWEVPPAEWKATPAGSPAKRTAQQVKHALNDIAAAGFLRFVGRYGSLSDLPSVDQVNIREWRDSDRRGEQLVHCLDDLHRQRHEEPIKVAVVWGAAHMAGVVDHLIDHYRYYVGGAEWISVARRP